MLIIRTYSIETAADGLRIVHSKETPYCPVCGYLLSGYDRRKRAVRCDDGSKAVYLLRRLSCPQCRRLHLETPDCILPQKHYAAQIIADTIAGKVDYCPADNSTIRRWKKNHPPVLPPAPADIAVCYSSTDTEEGVNEE